MVSQLQTQLKNASEIRSILREVPVSFNLADGRKVKTLLVFFPIKNGISDHAIFLEKIRKEILSNFVFTCKEIEKKLGVSNSNAAEKLFNKAVRKLSQHTAQGELGELILFTLLDIYFGAPKLLSKISTKTSRRMAVHGADAVHGQFYNGNFKLYLGESKLYTSFNDAATKAAKSIFTAKEKYQEEFDLLDTIMDFPNIDENMETKLLNLLDPFTNIDLSNVIQSPCFIGFAEPDIISNAKSEEEFIEEYTKLAASYIGSFYKKVENNKMDINETALLMLPYSNAESLVNGFIEHVGIKK